MMFYVESGIMVGIMAGVMGFTLNYGHLLSSLLSLEFLTLIGYWWLSLSSVHTGSDFFFSLFYLVMAACEGVLGLSLLISGVHSHGLDYMKAYSSLGC